MRIATQTQTVYRFDELPEDAREAALEKLRDINVDYPDWHEFVIDDAKRMAALMGIDIDDIYYSGFWSQGDGACFTGSYSYAKGCAKKIRREAPKDETLHDIADRLQGIQRRNFYRLTATVTHSGRYSHEHCTEVRVYRETEHSLVGDVDAETDEALTDILRDYMRWIYSSLESEHEWLTGDEAVIDTILANEYEFTSDGSIH